MKRFPARIPALGALLLLCALAPLASRAEPLRVSEADHHALAPEIAIGSHGDINVIWLERAAPGPVPAGAGPRDRHDSSMDLWFARSIDGGHSFSNPLRVNAMPGSVWGYAVSKPRIALGRSGTIHILYPGNEVDLQVGKPILSELYVRSRDGGRSFEAPRRLNSLTHTDKSATMDGGFAAVAAFGTLAVAPDGAVHAIWVDTRAMDGREGSAMAYAARSRDDGRSWSPDEVALDADVCPCCQFSLTFDGEGRMYLGSRLVTTDGHRNSTVARRDPGAARLGRRTQLFGTPWKLDGCPLKPTVVAVEGPTVWAASFSGAEQPAGVYLAVSHDRAATFAPAVALHPDAQVSDAPAIAMVRGRAVVAWHAKTSAIRRVYWRSLGPDEASAGPVTELGSPPGTSQAPALAARADGRVQIAWQQGEEIMTDVIDPASPAHETVAPATRLLGAAQLHELLAQYRGEVVMVNLWATFCVPCLKEIPTLVSLAGEFEPRGLRLLGLAMDEPGELEPRVEPFRRRYFPRFTSFLRDAPEMDTLAAVLDPAWNEILPTTYLVGRDGRVLRRIQGGRSEEELRRIIEAAL